MKAHRESPHRFLMGLAVLFWMVALSAAAAAAGPMGSLLGPGPVGLAAKRSADAAVVRSRVVAVNLDLLDQVERRLAASPGLAEKRAGAAPKITLELFDDVAFTMVVERVEKVSEKSTAFVGKVEGADDSQVVLVRGGGALAGSVALGDQRYRLQLSPEGLQVVEEVDVRAYPDEAEPELIREEAAPPAGPALALRDTGDRFDVMVVYTTAARVAAGGTTAIENLIALGISETNTAFANSGVIPRFRLVHTEEVAYGESGDAQVDRDRLKNPSDGFMDGVHTLRNTYGADLVELIVDNAGPNLCGIAYLMDGSNNTGFESSAFAVTARSCVSPNYTFGHELGHVMGCNHAPQDPTGTGAFSYSFGYKDPGQTFRTMMAYDCTNGCLRVLRWSNPDLPYNSLPSGTATQNNALSINNVRSVVANFRQEVATNTPPVVTITAPANGATVSPGTSVTFTGTATDTQDGNLAAILSWTSSLNGAIGTGASFSTSALSNGTHTITASVTDSGGLSGSAQITLNVTCSDSTAPTAAITSPTAGQNVSGTVTVAASASDNVGVAEVKFLVDGVVAASDKKAPYSFAWNTAAIAAGSHTLQAKAFDACGNVGNSSVISVNVVGVPDVAVFRNADGVEVLAGSTENLGSTPAGVATSVRYQIRNTGNGTLNLTNAATLVSGACFSEIETPVTPIAPAGTSYFRVRLLCSTPGTYSGSVSISSDDPNENPYVFNVSGTVTAAAAPDIAVSRNFDGVAVPQGSSQNIGSTNPGVAISMRFQIQNTGTAPLNLSNSTTLVSGTCFSQIETPVTPVAVGGISYFRVRLQCSTVGSYSGTVSILSDDPDESPYNFTVTGSVVPATAPDIGVFRNADGVEVPAGSSVSIGSTTVGVPTSLRFQIRNTGNADLNLTNAASLVSGSCFSEIETPVSPVPVGGTSFFRVRLQCGAAGSYSGTVSISSDDPDESPYTFTVTGTVTP